MQFEDDIGDVDDEDEELFPLKNADSPHLGELSDTSLEPESSTEKPKPETLKQGERIQSTPSIDSESDEDEQKWGPKKSAYYVNRDDLEDDESQELNLQETMRLQIKARSLLFEEDFGLDDYHSAPSSEDCCLSSIGFGSPHL
jgi:U3 small nucleolar RNA-associated protein 3